MIQWLLKASCRGPYEETELFPGFLPKLDFLPGQRTVFVSSNQIKSKLIGEFVLMLHIVSGALVYLAVIEK